MRLGIGLNIGQRNGFNPRNLFAGGVAGGWYDPSDISTLFQDAARTVPVTASGQTVLGVSDKSGNGNHLSATAGPTYTVSGGKSYLTFNGTTQFLTGNGLASLMSGADLTCTTINGHTLGVSGGATVYSWTRSSTSVPIVEQRAGNLSLAFVAHNFKTDDAAVTKNGGSAVAMSGKNVITVLDSGTGAVVRKNGTPSTSVDRDVGAITLDLFTIGARRSAGTPSFFTAMDWYGGLFIAGVLADPSVTSFEAYLTARL